jgi:uncharacterized protein (TIGR02147 family)
MQGHEFKNPVDWLKWEYSRRREKNVRFSQRAFSRLLGLPPGRVSELLSRKRGLSPSLGARISERLAHSAPERKRFLELVEQDQISRHRARALSGLGEHRSSQTEEYAELPRRSLSLLTQWESLAVLNLMKTKDFRSDVRWIARRLGITTSVAQTVLRRLSRAGLIQKAAGRWVRTQSSLRTSSDIPSTALRRAHRNYLKLAARALQEVAVEKRDITSITAAIDSSKLDEAKEIIRSFRRELAALLETGERDEVYQVSIALFPLTRVRATKPERKGRL